MTRRVRRSTQNCIRLGSGVGKKAMRRRAEIVERSFAHNLDRGGMRRTWLRGRDNVHKRYLVHVAGHNLGILMRLLIGAGTPREAAACGRAYLLFVYTENAVAVILVAAACDGLAILAMAITADPGRSKRDFSNGLIGLIDDVHRFLIGGTLFFIGFRVQNQTLAARSLRCRWRRPASAPSARDRRFLQGVPYSRPRRRRAG